MTTFTYRKNTVIEGTLVEETATHYTVEIKVGEATDLVNLEKELTVVTEEEAKIEFNKENVFKLIYTRKYEIKPVALEGNIMTVTKTHIETGKQQVIKVNVKTGEGLEKFNKVDQEKLTGQFDKENIMQQVRGI